MFALFGSLSSASTCAIKDNATSDMTQERVSDLFGTKSFS